MSLSPLDELFADAMQAQRKTLSSAPVMRNAKLEVPKKIEGLQLFQLEEYWQAKRVLLLIHQESHTAIGNFQEFYHKKVAGARKLIRLDLPCAVQAIEYISGWDHLGEEEVVRFQPQTWTAEREVMLEDLQLEKLDVHSNSLCEVHVCLSFGGVARVELLDHTTFSSLDGRTILTLPRGTNVLELMGFEAKILLRKELQK